MTIALRFLKLFVRSLPLPAAVGNVRRILVLDFSYLGDMVMASPVYRALKQNFPDASVEAMVFPGCTSILRMNPFVDEIHTHPTGSGTIDLSVVNRLRGRGYDLGVQMNTSLRNNFILWMIHPRFRLGYDYNDRGCFHNLRPPIRTRTTRTIYRIDEELSMLEKAFGWTISEREPFLSVDENCAPVVEEFLSVHGARGKEPLIGIHANCNPSPERRQWDQAKFAALADRLIETYGATIALTGSEADKEYVGTIIRSVSRQDRIINAAGALSLGELAALVKRLDLFVSINTGPLHIAIALKTPTVAIIGGRPAEIFCPKDSPFIDWVEDKALHPWDPQPLQPSIRSRMDEISVDDVLQKVRSMMARATSLRTASG